MKFKVIKIIDGDTFEVSPKWKWNDQTGSIIKAIGYNTPTDEESGFESPKLKLEQLISDKEVELINPARITNGQLLCEAYYNESNLKEYFPEYI